MSLCFFDYTTRMLARKAFSGLEGCILYAVNTPFVKNEAQFLEATLNLCSAEIAAMERLQAYCNSFDSTFAFNGDKTNPASANGPAFLFLADIVQIYQTYRGLGELISPVEFVDWAFELEKTNPDNFPVPARLKEFHTRKHTVERSDKYSDVLCGLPRFVADMLIVGKTRNEIARELHQLKDEGYPGCSDAVIGALLHPTGDIANFAQYGKDLRQKD